MSIKLKSRLSEYVLWVLIVGFLIWHLFITLLVMNPLGLIPLTLIGASAFFLYLRQPYLFLVLQLWAVYLAVTSGFKLVASYLQSIGSLSYDWNEISLFRNTFFLFTAGLIYYISRWQIEEE